MRICPPQLNRGETVAIIAPAGNMTDQDRFRIGRSILSNMGFIVAEQTRLWPGYGYLADSDGARLAELHRTWKDPSVKAIIALRGGFGCARLLNGLDLEIITKHPKLLVGFSDISILLNYISRKTGLICLHGPVCTTLPICNSSSLDRLYQSLTGNWHRDLNENVEVVRGTDPVEGQLLGGNLSSLAALIGTPYAPVFDNAIVFLEDINEPYYRLDRLFTQFAQAGMLVKAAGIILGDFSDDKDVDQLDRFRRNEFVWNRVNELTAGTGIPIWGNFPIGHGSRNLTLPIGALARMDSRTRTLSFLREAHGD